MCLEGHQEKVNIFTIRGCQPDRIFMEVIFGVVISLILEVGDKLKAYEKWLFYKYLMLSLCNGINLSNSILQ